MKQIITAIERNVYIGERADAPKGYICLRDAAVIRIWGTTAGLGEIALNGPTKNTILDACGTLTLPITSVIAIFDCVGK